VHGRRARGAGRRGEVRDHPPAIRAAHRGFGAIRQKLADMAIRLYAAESMLIRTAGLLDDRLHSGSDGSAMAAALEEFAIEASLVKVACSEMIDFVVDENVQIHGGNGYVADYRGRAAAIAMRA
jgi:alkylation response protein AidB-like acyl-CoA dehydrogenase